MLPGVTTLGEPLSRALGPRTAKALEDVFGLRTVGDLLRHYPRRYYTRGELTDLSSLREGDHVTVLARVVMVADHPLPSLPGKGRRSRTEVIVTDDQARLVLTFFFNNRRRPRWLSELVPGMIGMFAGTVSSFRGRRQLVHPECEMLPGAPPNADLTPELAAEFAAELIPVYPASARFPSWRIAKSVRTVLETLDAGEDPLPAELIQRYGLVGRAEAIRAIHRPLDWEDRDQARRRLKWDEAFMLQAALAQRRMAAAAMPAMPRPRVAGGIAEEFDARLPFTLTAGQVAVGETIAEELACAYPMHRLLQGEVGSGKTVIAIRAMLQVVDAGGQAALLAPTEVLAQQHYRSVTDMLGPLAQGGQFGAAEHATSVALLTGSAGAAARRSALSDVFTGDAGIVIGTHALLEEQVQFADLGLVVIDEQHRFGVEQRDALRAKAADARPHVLVMTATPIPRTVAMTVYGDLETSTLAELPAGRSAIATHVVPVADKPRYLERAWERVREEVGRGQQAYVVCPRIGDGSDPDAPDQAGYPDEEDFGGVDMTGGIPRGVVLGRRQPLSVLDVAATLDAGPLAGLRLGILHGLAAPGGEGPGDARVLRGRDRRPGGDHRDRGGGRRACRHRDGHHGRRAVRRVPAAPAPRPGGPRDRAGAVPAGHRGAGGQPGAGAARRGGLDARRVQAVPAGPGATPRGRCARRRPGRAAVEPAAAPAARRRGPDQAGQGRRHGRRFGRPGPGRPSGAAHRHRRAARCPSRIPGQDLKHLRCLAGRLGALRLSRCIRASGSIRCTGSPQSTPEPGSTTQIQQAYPAKRDERCS